MRKIKSMLLDITSYEQVTHHSSRCCSSAQLSLCARNTDGTDGNTVSQGVRKLLRRESRTIAPITFRFIISTVSKSPVSYQCCQTCGFLELRKKKVQILYGFLSGFLTDEVKTFKTVSNLAFSPCSLDSVFIWDSKRKIPSACMYCYYCWISFYRVTFKLCKFHC